MQKQPIEMTSVIAALYNSPVGHAITGQIMTFADHIAMLYDAPVGFTISGERVTFERGDNFLRLIPLTNGKISDIIYRAYTSLIQIAPSYFRIEYKPEIRIYWGITPPEATVLPGARQMAIKQAAINMEIFK